ncbi:MAG: hypothetical protein ABIV47_15120, partial [Roseiflexaceae bacterium]
RMHGSMVRYLACGSVFLLWRGKKSTHKELNIIGKRKFYDYTSAAAIIFSKALATLAAKSALSARNAFRL